MFFAFRGFFVRKSCCCSLLSVFASPTENKLDLKLRNVRCREEKWVKELIKQTSRKSFLKNIPLSFSLRMVSSPFSVFIFILYCQHEPHEWKRLKTPFFAAVQLSVRLSALEKLPLGISALENCKQFFMFLIFLSTSFRRLFFSSISGSVCKVYFIPPAFFLLKARVTFSGRSIKKNREERG